MKLLLTESQYSKLKSLTNNTNQDSFELIKEFIRFCKSELGITKSIKVKIKEKRDNNLTTFAYYSPSEKTLCVYIKGRHIADVLRSIAHELKHFHQDLNGELTKTSGEDGSPHENEANSFAGIMLRKFGKKNPKIYE